jgi:hypothetical protein
MNAPDAIHTGIARAKGMHREIHRPHTESNSGQLFRTPKPNGHRTTTMTPTPNAESTVRSSRWRTCGGGAGGR